MACSTSTCINQENPTLKQDEKVDMVSEHGFSLQCDWESKFENWAAIIKVT